MRLRLSIVEAAVNALPLCLLVVVQALLSVAAPSETLPTRFGVVIDAGSTGTRIHVYMYRDDGRGVAPEVELPGAVLSVRPGLSEYAGRPEQGAATLAPLLEFAKQQVPRALVSSTPLFFSATAGLRLLPPDQTEALVAAVRRRLSSSRFMFRDDWAAVIPGRSEGLFAWLAFNYAAGLLPPMPASEAAAAAAGSSSSSSSSGGSPSSWGVLELGGASVQLTFAPSPSSPSSFSRGRGPDSRNYNGAGAAVVVGRRKDAAAVQQQQQQQQQGLTTLDALGSKLTLYTHSFLGAGTEAAWARVGQLQAARKASVDVCMPSGTASDWGAPGGGSFDDCATLASQLLPRRNCTTSTSAAIIISGGGVVASSSTGSQQPASSSGSNGSGSSSSRLSCTLDGQPLPPGPLPGPFLATEGFYYTAQRLGLLGQPTPAPSLTQTPMPTQQQQQQQQQQQGSANATLAAWRAAGRQFCGTPWPDLVSRLVVGQGQQEDLVRKTCFSAAYGYMLMAEMLQLGTSDDEDGGGGGGGGGTAMQQLVFSNSVPGRAASSATAGPQHSLPPVEVGWTLGQLLVDIVPMAARINRHQQLRAAPAWQSEHAVVLLLFIALCAAVAWQSVGAARGGGAAAGRGLSSNRWWMRSFTSPAGGAATGGETDVDRLEAGSSGKIALLPLAGDSVAASKTPRASPGTAASTAAGSFGASVPIVVTATAGGVVTSPQQAQQRQRAAAAAVSPDRISIGSV